MGAPWRCGAGCIGVHIVRMRIRRRTKPASSTPWARDFFADPPMRVKVARRIPVGRVGEAAEIGRFVAGLTTEPVGFLTGETIYLDGAQNVAL